LKRHLIGILLFSVLQFNLSAQIISDVSISADTIEIGETIDVIFKLTTPNPTLIKHIDFSVYDSIQSVAQEDEAMGIDYFAEIDWTAPFAEENYKKIKLNTSLMTQGNGGLTYIDTFKATFWDNGVFPIGHPNIVLQENVEQNIRLMQPTLLWVTPPLEGIAQDTTQAILPIKPMIKEAKKLSDYLFILYALLGLLLVGGLLYYFLRPKPAALTQTKTITILPSHTIALNKLNALESKGLWQSGNIKEFQSVLTFIIREYLEKRFSINALESTTGQIKRALKNEKLDVDQENNLTEILQIADLVKFAKAKPQDEIHSEFLQKAREFVERTKNPDDIEREETIIINSENSEIKNG